MALARVYGNAAEGDAVEHFGRPRGTGICCVATGCCQCFVCGRRPRYSRRGLRRGPGRRITRRGTLAKPVPHSLLGLDKALKFFVQPDRHVAAFHEDEFRVGLQTRKRLNSS